MRKIKASLVSTLRKEQFYACLLGLYCVYYLFTSLSLAWDFTTDDAYISFIYARQFANGYGLHWHEALPLVEGYSSFLWVMIATLIMKLHMPLIVTLKYIATLSLTAGLFFLYRLARLFFTPLLAMLPIFIFSHYQGVAWWTVSGMESMLYCALSLLLIWQSAVALGYSNYSEGQRSPKNLCIRAWIITNITLFLLGLTRFEGVVWAIPVRVFLLCELRQVRVRDLFYESKTLYLWLGSTFFCFILPYVIYYVWRFNYFGHWIPNSYLCKALIIGQVGVLNLDYLEVIMPLIIASVPYCLAPKDCRHILLWLPSVLYALMLWQADPVVAYYLRLFLAPFALLTVLSVLGVNQFLHYFEYKTWRLKIITCLTIIGLTLIFIPNNDTQNIQHLVQHYQERSQLRMITTKILNEQAATGATVLLNDCGQIPFNARPDIRFIDAQCLNNTELTEAPYKHNLRLYAEHLDKQVKPDWVIITYYPLRAHHYDFLTELLEEKHFFKHYQLIETLKSGVLVSGGHKTIDYVYLIYKRK